MYIRFPFPYPVKDISEIQNQFHSLSKFLFMKKTITFLWFLLCLVACKKNTDSSSTVPPPQTDTLKKVTNFVFHYNGAPDISEVQMYDVITQNVGYVFQSDPSGIYTLEFHGLNGREILQGDISNPNYNNTAHWPIGNNDTFRIKKNGIKYVDVVADNSNINSGILIEVPIQGTLPDSIKARVLRFTRPGGAMEGMKFKTL